MADTKISALNALTGANVALATDVLAIVPEVIDTGAPATIVVELRTIVVPLVPTSQSATVAPVESTIRAHEAVPELSAEASAVMAESVIVPEAAAGAAGSEHGSEAKSTCVVMAVFAFAGCVPS